MSGRGRGQALKEAIAKVRLNDPSSVRATTIDDRVKKEGTLCVPIFEPQEWHGAKGSPERLVANYIKLEKCDGTEDTSQGGIHEYHLEFCPQIDNLQERFRCLYQHKDAIGQFHVFDGKTLHLPFRITMESLPAPEQNIESQSTSSIKLNYKGIKSYGSPVSINILNNLFRKVMHKLELVKMSRNSYNPKAKHLIPSLKLEIWPGYVTAIDEYEGGLLLTCDVSHRILRTETVYDFVLHGRDKSETLKSLLGLHVITRYNNRTYRIDDVAMDMSPQDTFKLSSGASMSYTEYYRTRYNLEIKDIHQPLLISRKKERSDCEEMVERTFCLIPELCYLTGLSEEMRKNFQLMKEVSNFTRLSPTQRQTILKTFIQSVNGHPEASAVLSGWGLRLSECLVTLNGRVLDPETLYFGKDLKFKAIQADWSSSLRTLLTPVNLEKWILAFPRSKRGQAVDFEKSIIHHGSKMGIVVKAAQMVIFNDDRIMTMLEDIKANVNQRVSLIVSIFPHQRSDRYAAFKKFCCLENPIPSQVICSKTLENPRRLSSIVAKISLQIQCKLGGELWGCPTPYAGLMVVGIDVYHDASRLEGSVAAICSSTNHSFSLWHSQSLSPQGRGQELIDTLKIAFIECLRAYRARNNVWPRSVVVFRDGIGNAQINVSAQTEITSLKSALKAVVEPNETVPKYAFVIVQKRINTRFWTAPSSSLSSTMSNPKPGTVVDTVVTRTNHKEFFLISQNVRQGTVSPTHFIVVEASENLKPDTVQCIAYKLTHMYFNWPGTIRVPAPCLYSHKLASLIGEHLHQNPTMLQERLFYL